MNTQLHTTSNKLRNDREVLLATVKKETVIGTLSLETRMNLHPIIIVQARISL